MNTHLDKIGGVGSIIAAAAAAAPCCLPFLAAIGGAIGFGAFSSYSNYFSYGVHAFAFLALVGAFLSFQKHKNAYPLALVIISFVALIYVYNIALVAWLLYTALALLGISAIWNTISIKRCNQCKAPA
ncbi:MAG: hypothetical protein KJO81_01885 [Gammaproteobacteria bacterium]|nr:hypothetical protein [Gammaproteobacteria bacterium]